MPEFKLSREALFKAEPTCMNCELKGLTKYMHNTSLQPNLYVFVNENDKFTEFVSIQP
jgi:hypothetical protein